MVTQGHFQKVNVIDYELGTILVIIES
jgi:hypothetical protein